MPSVQRGVCGCGCNRRSASVRQVMHAPARVLTFTDFL